MNVRRIVPALFLGALVFKFHPVAASELSVQPVLLEMDAPTAAGALQLRSPSDVPVTVQTRVERWVQRNGVETLEPTTDVVASPPIVRIAPNTNYVVRIVRISGKPFVHEESYRVLVDQLPNPPREPGRAINLLIRQSIPIFFRASNLTPPDVSWQLRRKGRNVFVTATNKGDEHLRIASLRLSDGSGRSLSFGNGLVGYVLGHSKMSWKAPPARSDFGSHGPIRVFAKTNKGDLETEVK